MSLRREALRKLDDLKKAFAGIYLDLMTITRLESDRFAAFEKIDFKPCGADPRLRLGSGRAGE